MNLVWHAQGLLEADWLRDVLGDLIDSEVTDIDLRYFDDNAIHVVSSNWRPLPSYEDYFRKCRAKCSRIVLFHASDEWFSGGYGLYQYFDSVVRNFRTYLAGGHSILTIPEGYSNGTKVGGPIQPANQRRYAWMFTGEVKASRVDMLAAFDGLEPKFVNSTASISDPAGVKLSKTDFDAALMDTIFSLCPMGNAILETWRLYESLELGCIPLVEKRVSLDYFAALFGANPIPAFQSWIAARRFTEAALADKPGLLQLQQTIGIWWTAHKATVRKQLRDLLQGPSRAGELQRFGRLARNRLPLVHEPLRLAELLRHQSGGSLCRRLTHPSGPMKRIVSDALRNFG